jgi:hypothetical protein
MFGLGSLAQTRPSTAPAPSPCLDEAAHPEYRQLDFWVGEWEVFNGDKKLADVSVTKILNNCALSESWKGSHGDGVGISLYNARIKKWEYFWAADHGATSFFVGELLSNEMRYRMEQPQPDGTVRLRHWSLTKLPDGKVRELSVGSTDDGATWNTEYDYTWVLKKA